MQTFLGHQEFEMMRDANKKDSEANTKYMQKITEDIHKEQDIEKKDKQERKSHTEV